MQAWINETRDKVRVEADCRGIRIIAGEALILGDSRYGTETVIKVSRKELIELLMKIEDAASIGVGDEPGTPPEPVCDICKGWPGCECDKVAAAAADNGQ